MKNYLFLLLLVILISSCTVFKSVQSQEEKHALQLFNDYTKAFNEHDMAKVVSYFSDDFAWISIKPKVFETLVRGKAQLIESNDKYFKTYPNVKTKIIQVTYDEGFVWTQELVTWSMGKDKITQLINAVYYINEGKIQRLWYFEPPDEIVNE
jgi:hypothetical protein